MTRQTNFLWIVLLSSASLAASWALACATPFAALAALAATRLNRRDGVATMLVAWFASQAVGFGIHHYPHSATTLLWGGAIGTAAIAALLVARVAERHIGGHPLAVLAGAFLAASLGYKGALALSSLVLGGAGIAFSPVYFAEGLLRDGAILIGLTLLSRLLVSIGVAEAARVRAVAG